MDEAAIDRDRRQAARNAARVEVRITAPGHEGSGLLTELSYAGARVEECSSTPPVGAEARIRFEVPGMGRLELTGTVQRAGPSEFALACAAEGLSDRERVDRVTALLFAASTP